MALGKTIKFFLGITVAIVTAFVLFGLYVIGGVGQPPSYGTEKKFRSELEKLALVGLPQKEAIDILESEGYKCGSYGCTRSGFLKAVVCFEKQDLDLVVSTAGTVLDFEIRVVRDGSLPSICL
jgi:hypothetical protein